MICSFSILKFLSFSSNESVSHSIKRINKLHKREFTCCLLFFVVVGRLILQSLFLFFDVILHLVDSPVQVLSEGHLFSVLEFLLFQLGEFLSERIYLPLSLVFGLSAALISPLR